LEDTVAKELQTLHNLRKLFVQDLQARIKKVCVNLKKNILYLKRDAVGLGVFLTPLLRFSFGLFF
jgi:hypothetical protein